MCIYVCECEGVIVCVCVRVCVGGQAKEGYITFDLHISGLLIIVVLFVCKYVECIG